MKPELEQLVRLWEGRWRLMRFLARLPRALWGGLVLAILSAFIGRTLNWLTIPQALALGAGWLAMSALLWGVWVYRPRPLVLSARRFDVLFGLQERVSTALELQAGRITTTPTIATRQAEEALIMARRVPFRQHLTLTSPPRDWLAVALLLMVFGAVLAMPASVIGLNALDAQDRINLDEANETLRDITEDIANTTSLTPEERAPLLDMLERNLEALREAPTPEEAFSIMSDVEQTLRQQAQRLDEGRRTDEALAQALSPFTPPDSQPQDARQQLRDTLTQLADTLPELSAQQRQQLRDALNQADNALNQADNALNQADNADDANLSQALTDALQALADEDLAGVQDALNQADAALQEGEQEAQRQRQASDELTQSADQAQQSAQDIARAEQNEQNPQNEQTETTQSQPSEQGQTQQSDDEEQANQAQQDGQSQEGDSATASDEQGETPGDEGVTSDQSATTASDEQAPDAPPNSQQSGTGQSDTASENVSPPTSARATGDESTPGDETTNSTDERDFEAIYAPQRLNADGTQTIILTPDTSDMTTREGDLNQAGDENARIPYSQVFGQYNEAVTNALQGGTLPPALRDIVRDYFTRINPQTE